MVAAPSQQATRHARRVYVGGLPPTATEQNVATFFSNALAAIGGTTAGPGAHFCCMAGSLPCTISKFCLSVKQCSVLRLMKNLVSFA